MGRGPRTGRRATGWRTLLPPSCPSGVARMPGPDISKSAGSGSSVASPCLLTRSTVGLLSIAWKAWPSPSTALIVGDARVSYSAPPPLADAGSYKSGCTCHTA